MRTNVYLTVDTEHSMGGAWSNPAMKPVPTERRIFCRIDGKDHGIGWLCDELGRHDFQATFFCEMFGSLIFGKDDTRAWCQYLLDRGQDVQLHAHLNFYYYALQQSGSGRVGPRTDDLADLPSPTRGDLLEEACALFRYAVGRCPAVFRAGNWRASRDLIADIAASGIALDSSFNPATRMGGSFAGEGLAFNSLQKVDGVWELPLTTLHQSLPEPHLVDGFRPFDLVSLSTNEIRMALEDAHRLGVKHIVTVLHSFSGIKARDVQYRTMKPNRVVRGRVRYFLDYLARHRDRFRVTTCGALVSELKEASPETARSLPQLGLVHPFARKVVQTLNSFYWT